MDMHETINVAKNDASDVVQRSTPSIAQINVEGGDEKIDVRCAVWFCGCVV